MVTTMWNLHAWMSTRNSKHATFLPLHTVPGRPSDVTLVLMNSTAVTLYWKQTQMPNGVILSYQVACYGYKSYYGLDVRQVHFNLICRCVKIVLTQTLLLPFYIGVEGRRSY